MLNRIVSPLREGFSQLYALLKQQELASTANFCCISFNQANFALAYVRKTEQKPELFFCEVSVRHDHFSQDLSSWIKEQGIEGMSCSWMLSPEHYQLVAIENLPVTEDEFQSAIRWKMRDFIPFPIEEAVIDYFPIPKKPAETANMIMVVVARKNYLQAVSQDILESGLSLAVIDIPELGLRNMTALYEQDEKSTALLYFLEDNIQLLITCQKKLYFTRRIPFDVNNITASPDTTELPVNLREQLDKLALEIQRSFDYYHTQWRNPAPARAFWASAKPISQAAKDYLLQYPTVPIQALNVTDYFVTRDVLSLDQQGKCLLSIGGALRIRNEKNAATD